MSRPSRRVAVRDPLAVLALVETLDLPDVWLDPGSLDLFDRPQHEVGAELLVVAVLIPTDRFELRVLGRHQQLKEVLAVVVVEPVPKPLETLGLPLVHLLVAVWVVANENLAEGRVEVLDVLAEVVAVLEVELVLAGLLDRHGEQQALRFRLPNHIGAELFVDQDPCSILRGALVERLEEPLEDQTLGIDDRVGLLRARVPLDAEHLLLERASMVEREDV